MVGDVSARHTFGRGTGWDVDVHCMALIYLAVKKLVVINADYIVRQRFVRSHL